MNLLNFFKRDAESPKGDPAIPIHSAVPVAASQPLEQARAPVRIELEHADWSKDAITAGSHPEATQLATVRQLARVAGTILAKNTPDTESAVQMVRDVSANKIELENFNLALYAAVTTVSGSSNLNDATRRLVRQFVDDQPELLVTEKLRVILGLASGAFTRMMDNLLSKPEHGNEKINGDRSMKSTFGADGFIEHLSIRINSGFFSRALERHLAEVAKAGEEKGAALLDKGPLPQGELLNVHLVLNNRVAQFKVTAEELGRAYFGALMEYAAEGYASRVRNDAALAAVLDGVSCPKLA